MIQGIKEAIFRERPNCRFSPAGWLHHRHPGGGPLRRLLLPCGEGKFPAQVYRQSHFRPPLPDPAGRPADHGSLSGSGSGGRLFPRPSRPAASGGGAAAAPFPASGLCPLRGLPGRAHAGQPGGLQGVSSQRLPAVFGAVYAPAYRFPSGSGESGHRYLRRSFRLPEGRDALYRPEAVQYLHFQQKGV